MLAEADTRADAIRAGFAARIRQESERIANLAREQEEAIIEAGEQQGQQAARRLHQERQLAAKAAVLQAKQQALQALQADAIKEILAWPARETKSLLTALLELLPDTPGLLTPGEHSAETLSPLVARGPHRLAKEVIPADGGFIYRTRSTEMNLTISHLVEQLCRRRRAELARELFG